MTETVGKITTFEEYQRLAQRTAAGFAGDMHLIRSAMGMTGEAGEYCDAVKKVIFHGAPADREKLIKEAGDVLWYVADAAAALGIGMDEIAYRNIKKLEQRYPELIFSTEASVNRVDVNGGGGVE